jgi:RNA polymerase sigma factor (sigma-70 family)
VTVDWSRIYRTTFPDLVRYLYRRTWDRERAEDLAQEAFLRGLDAEPDDPRAWLFAVAGNLATDEVRKVVRRRRHLALIEATDGARVDDNDPEGELLRRERAAQARVALESLSERDREVLLLWDAGLGYGEIAVRTGLARGAIGTTLARARKRLAESCRRSEPRQGGTAELEGGNDVARG